MWQGGVCRRWSIWCWVGRLRRERLVRVWAASRVAFTKLGGVRRWEGGSAEEAIVQDGDHVVKEVRQVAVAQEPIDHDEVDVSMVIQTLKKNASNAQNMIKEVIKTFKDFSVENDPANDCLDNAIITDPKLRTEKTIKKLQHVAGRVLNKK